MIESLFGDKSCSWVRIVNGIHKYVTEMLENIRVESIGEKSSGNLVAKARPQQKSKSTLSPVSVSYLERKWIDKEPGIFDQHCREVSKLMIRLLRHDDSVNREQDGAVKIEDLASIFPSRITSSSHCSIRTWLRFLQRGGEIKKRFLRSIRGHSGGIQIDPTLQQNVLFTRRRRRPHLSRWKLSRLTLYHPVWIDSWWEKCQEREACCVLYSRECDVRRTAQISRIRPGESKNCRVQKLLDNSPKYSVLCGPKPFRTISGVGCFGIN